MLLRRHQNFLRIRQIEITVLAKDVAAFGQLLLRHGRQHLVNDKRDVLFGCPAKLFRNRVCAEKRRDKFNRGRLVQSPDNAENFQFFLERQSVAGLGLHRRGPAAQEPVCSLLRVREKFPFARRAGLAHGRTNPTATGGDLFVSRAPRPHLEFIHSIPAEDGMSMRVHETRQHHPIYRVDNLDIARQLALDFVGGSDRRDHTVPDQHSAVLDDREMVQFATNPRSHRTGESQQLRSMEDSESVQCASTACLPRFLGRL